MNLKQKKRAHAAIQRADLVILGGGGLFVDAETWRAPALWATQARACRRLKTPYICYGQSVGPLRYRFSRFLTRGVFKHAKAIHVRDQASVHQLQALGLEEVTLGSDPALSWLLEQNERVTKKDFLLVSLRKWDAKTAQSWPPILKAIKSFASSKALEPVILPMDVSDEKEIKALKKTGLVVLKIKDVKEAFEYFRGAKMAITMRLHASVFALISRLPFVSLSYSTKVESLMKTLQVKGGFTLLKVGSFKKAKLERSMKNTFKKGPSKANLETPVMENQAFLAHQLD